MVKATLTSFPEVYSPHNFFKIHKLFSNLNTDTVRGMSRLLGNAISALVLVIALA